MTTETTAPTPKPRLSVWLDHRGRPHPLKNAKRFLRILGPGLITGAADDDPSGIGTYSQAGAAFGASQLWLALYMLPLIIAVQEMCGRIGLVSGKGIAAIVRERYNRPILYGAVTLLFVANTINIGADLGAMAASVALIIPGLPVFLTTVLFSVIILLLEVFIPYASYSRVLKVLSLSLLTYVISGIIINPDWGSLLKSTFIPTISFSPVFLALIIGILGTTISPYLFFWQASEEVEESAKFPVNAADDAPRQRQLLKHRISLLRIDTIFGMIASITTFWFIVMATSSTLHAAGITNITSADQAAKALEPLVRSFPNAGVLTKLLFSLGVIGTGLLAVPVLAGSSAYGIAESIGWNEGLSLPLRHARGFYGVIAISTIVGLLLNLLGINPIAALVYSAIINGIIAVPLLVLILLVANNKNVMGEHRNSLLSNIIVIITTVAMGIAALFTIVSLFPH